MARILINNRRRVLVAVMKLEFINGQMLGKMFRPDQLAIISVFLGQNLFVNGFNCHFIQAGNKSRAFKCKTPKVAGL